MKKLIHFLLFALPLLSFEASFAQYSSIPITQTILHNTNPRTIQSKTYFDTISRSPYYFNDRYWHSYKVRLEAGEQLYVRYESPAYSVALIVCDSTGHGLFLKKDTVLRSMGNNSSTEFMTPVNISGDYYIAVSTNDANAIGNYGLQISVAGKESLQTLKNASFMDKYYFLSEHSSAHYIFIIGNEIKPDKYSGALRAFEAPVSLLPNIPGTFKYIRSIEYAQNNIYWGKDLAAAKKKFDDYIKLIKSQIPSEWETKTDIDALEDMPVFTVEDPDSGSTIELNIIKNTDGTYSVNLTI